MRRIAVPGVLSLACLGLLVAAAPASAAAFYVDDVPHVPGFCTTPPPADPCSTITEAIGQARGGGFPGGDTIVVAAGTYPEEVNFDDPADAGNILDGAGTSTTGSGTVVQIPTAGFFTVTQSSITVKDVAVQGSNTQTVTVFAPGGAGSPIAGDRLENVLIEVEDTANAESAIGVGFANNAVLDRVEVTGDAMWDGASAHALEATGGSVTVNDSNLSSNFISVINFGSALRFNRTTIAGAPPAGYGESVIQARSDPAGGAPAVTLDSSRVIFGDLGLEVVDNTAAASTSAVVLNSTIDSNVAQSATGGGIAATATNPADVTDVTIDSSIVVGALSSTGGGTGTMTCTYSDVPNTTQAAPREISCATGAGNPGNNSTSTPSALFDPGLFGLNWHLLAGGPAIDSGDPAPLAAGQSTTDLDGNPRVLDGNLDCVARRDRGAYEETGLSAACPTPPSAPSQQAPTTSTTPGPTGLRAAALKKCKKKTTAAARRKCKRRANLLPL